MTEQTLEDRKQTLEVFQRDQTFQKDQRNQIFQMDQRDQTFQKNQKPDSMQQPSTGKAIIHSRYARAYARTTGVLLFCCHKCHTNHINHYTTIIYIDDRSNIQILSHFHAATPPQKLPQTPSSKQHFQPPTQNNPSLFKNNPSLFTKQPVTFHKTTRHFSRNNPSLFTKRPVTLHKTTCHFA